MLHEDKIAYAKGGENDYLSRRFLCTECFHLFLMVELLRLVMHNAFNIPLSQYFYYFTPRFGYPPSLMAKELGA